MANPRSLETAELVTPLMLRTLPGSGAAGVGVVLGTGVACFLAQWTSVMLWVGPAQVSTVWLPGGLMLAIALLTEPRRWLAVLTAAGAGTTLLWTWLGLVRPSGAILLGALAALQTAGVATALRAVQQRAFPLGTFRDFLSYLVVVVAGGTAVASMLFGASTSGMAIRPATFLVWRTFALAALLGYLLVTPTVLLLVQQAHAIRRASTIRRLEASLLAALVALVTGVTFTGVARSTTWAVFAMALPPLLLWAVLRFGTLGACSSLLLVAMFSTLSTARGLGPFTRQTAADNTLSLQLLVLGTAWPLLGLAVVLSHQRRTAAALNSSHLRLKGLTRQLIAAREEEATRIGRELHDDIGQRLALVSIGLGRLRQVLLQTAPVHAPDLRRLQEQTGEIARTLRDLSHQLHPLALEHLGLVTALELNCDEVRHATGLDIRLANHGRISAPPDVALCLYRVAQEALNNVTRHAGAHHVELSLEREGSELLLEVSDDGRGFELAEARPGGGLGLHYAAERVRSIGGRITIESAVGAGTRLRVAVPVPEVAAG